MKTSQATHQAPRRSFRPALALLALPAACVLVSFAAPQSAAEDASAVTAEQIEQKLRFLASDEMRGRDTGSPESVRAAEWMAALLERAGVAPGGDVVDGEPTYLQAIGVRGIRVTELPRLALVGEEGALGRLEHGADFDLVNARRQLGVLSVVHVDATEDVPSEPSLEVALFLDGSNSDRRDWLEVAGTPDGAGWGALIHPGSKERRAPERATVPLAANGLVTTLRVHGPLLKHLRDGAPRTIALELAVEAESTPAYNVVGTIAGAGTAQEPELADEIVVYTAHYDHLGIRAPRPDDPPDVDLVMNGADDDASGTVAVLEIAEALAAGPPPARTLVFLLVTGEERRLIGTRYYIDALAHPLERIVCNLNFEMVGRPDELVGGAGKLWLTGYERSTLGAAFRDAQIAVSPDLRPEQNFFRRSDNIEFAMRGVVAHTLSSYNMHQDYHRPSDEVDTIDFEHMQAAVQAGLAAARMLADGSVDPAWNEGGDPSVRREDGSRPK